MPGRWSVDKSINAELVFHAFKFDVAAKRRKKRENSNSEAVTSVRYEIEF